MGRWPILRADAGGALLSAAARGAGCGCGAGCGPPSAPMPVQLDGGWRSWSGPQWPVMAAGAGGVDNGEGVSAGVGGVDELELLELLLWWWRGGTPAPAAA